MKLNREAIWPMIHGIFSYFVLISSCSILTLGVIIWKDKFNMNIYNENPLILWSFFVGMFLLFTLSLYLTFLRGHLNVYTLIASFICLFIPSLKNLAVYTSLAIFAGGITIYCFSVLYNYDIENRIVDLFKNKEQKR